MALVESEPIIVSGTSFVEPGLLRVNKAIRAETESIFYAENNFCIHILNANSDVMMMRKRKSTALAQRDLSCRVRYLHVGGWNDWPSLERWMWRVKTGLLS